MRASVSDGPSIAILAIPAIISASAALSGVALSAGSTRRVQRQRLRRERYSETIRLARRVVYLHLTKGPPTANEDSLQQQQEITEAEAEFSLFVASSVRETSANFIDACTRLTEAMVSESLTPRLRDLHRMILAQPPRISQDRITSAQTIFGAFVHMAVVADIDLGPSRVPLARSTPVGPVGRVAAPSGSCEPARRVRRPGWPPPAAGRAVLHMSACRRPIVGASCAWRCRRVARCRSARPHRAGPNCASLRDHHGMILACGGTDAGGEGGAGAAAGPDLHRGTGSDVLEAAAGGGDR